MMSGAWWGEAWREAGRLLPTQRRAHASIAAPRAPHLKPSHPAPTRSKLMPSRCSCRALSSCAATHAARASALCSTAAGSKRPSSTTRAPAACAAHSRAGSSFHATVVSCDQSYLWGEREGREKRVVTWAAAATLEPMNARGAHPRPKWPAFAACRPSLPLIWRAAIHAEA